MDEFKTQEPEPLLEQEEEEPALLEPTEEQESEPSYAYLLEKDKQRMCRKDLGYCIRDQEGKPVPFCFEYPDDEGCRTNTHPPHILFMGCYDDATCGGKPLGKVVLLDKDPPYAYTVDGKCFRSSKLCAWDTNRIAVPQCSKEQKDVAKCRDRTDDFLVGCYTEETCGGNVMEGRPVNPPPRKHNQPPKKSQPSSVSSSKPSKTSQAYAVKESVKRKQTNRWMVIVVVVILLLLLMSAAVFYYHYRKKTPLWKSLSSYFQGRKPHTP